MVKTPIIYPGGKTSLLPHIRPLVPPHKLCLDLFGGGGAFILDDSHETGVYNDLNNESVNFFRVLRDREDSARLRQLLELTPYARQEFQYCDRTWEGISDRVERARRWYITVSLSFTHETSNHSFRVSVGNNPARAIRNHIDNLPHVISKLRNVVIENLDFRRALEIYGHGSDTLIFADPPYITDRNTSLGYENMMDSSDHLELIRMLTNTDADVILCGYESDLYTMNLVPPKWELVKKVRVAQVGNSDYKTRESRVEHIWVKKKSRGLFQ